MSAAEQPPSLRRSLRAWLEDQQAFGLAEGPRGVLAAARRSARAPASAGADAPLATAGPEPQAILEAIAQEAEACRACPLATSRNRCVPGQGNPRTRILFVGEAPGADEDRQGLAFVGRSGQLLTRMIAAMGFTREEVFIANVLKCRPPGNRDPRPEEAAACLPFLQRQIAALRPEVMIALGGQAAHNLLANQEPVGRLRGRVHEFAGIPVVVTYHPSYLLRQPGEKRKAWHDLRSALGLLGLEPPPKASSVPS